MPTIRRTPAAVSSQIQFNATNNVFENNILYAGAQGLLVNDFTTSSADPAQLDYNLYFLFSGRRQFGLELAEAPLQGLHGLSEWHGQ